MAGGAIQAVAYEKLMILLRWISWIFNATLTLWRLIIHRINHVLLYWDYAGRRRTDFYHKVLLVGDGLAQGFGASISTGCTSGVVRKLNNSFHRQPNIRTKWCFFERGSLNSRTEDWLPSGKLLETTLNSYAARDVEMVVIMVGLQDLLQIKDATTLLDLAAATAGETKPGQEEIPLVKNLRIIIQYLLDRGLYVGVCNLPMVGEPSSIRAKVIGGANRQIKIMVDSYEEKVALIEANTRRVCKKENRSYDGVHLNTDGYNALGLSILEQINNFMVQIEWHAFQAYLKGEKPIPERKKKWYQVDAPEKTTRSAAPPGGPVDLLEGEGEEHDKLIDANLKKTQ